MVMALQVRILLHRLFLCRMARFGKFFEGLVLPQDAILFFVFVEFRAMLLSVARPTKRQKTLKKHFLLAYFGCSSAYCVG